MSHQDLSPQGWAPKIQKKGRTLIVKSENFLSWYRHKMLDGVMEFNSL